MLTLVTRTLAIGTYMEDYYIPSLVEYDWHISVNDLTSFMAKVFKLPIGDGRDRRDFAIGCYLETKPPNQAVVAGPHETNQSR